MKKSVVLSCVAGAVVLGLAVVGSAGAKSKTVTKTVAGPTVTATATVTASPTAAVVAAKPAVTKTVVRKVVVTRTATRTVTRAPAAPKQFGEGTYVVGKDIQAGTYHTTGAGADGMCYWARLSSLNTSDILDNSVSSGPQTIQVSASDKALTISGSCTFGRS